MLSVRQKDRLYTIAKDIVFCKSGGVGWAKEVRVSFTKEQLGAAHDIIRAVIEKNDSRGWKIINVWHKETMIDCIRHVLTLPVVPAQKTEEKTKEENALPF